MILQIDVTVTGPGQVLTGSVAVTVDDPPEQAAAQPARQAPPAVSPDLAGLRRQQRAQARRAAR